MHARRMLAMATLLAGAAWAPAAHAQSWTATKLCNFAGTAAAPVTNGFYITSYAGTNLGQVQLGFTTSTGAVGTWRITLTAHRARFDGPLVGAPQTVTVTVPDSGEALPVFDFGAAPLTPGDTVAFTFSAQQLSGAAGTLMFDAGTGSCSNIIRTQNTNPPLSTPVGSTVGLIVTQQTLSAGACTPSDTVLCIDRNPGDRRFRATITYSTTQSGGLAGDGQAIPLSSLGVRRGGLFWFFDQSTPEMLVKVLDGCVFNNHFWVYFSATTNVGFTLHVTDTVTGQTYTYTNPDRTLAPPVQNASTLACS